MLVFAGGVRDSAPVVKGLLKGEKETSFLSGYHELDALCLLAVRRWLQARFLVVCCPGPLLTLTTFGYWGERSKSVLLESLSPAKRKIVILGASSEIGSSFEKHSQAGGVLSKDALETTESAEPAATDGVAGNPLRSKNGSSRAIKAAASVFS